MSKNRFKSTIDSPEWEGLVIPGIERGDERFKLFAASPKPSLAPYIQSSWLMNWNIPSGELYSIVVPTPCIHFFSLSVPIVSDRPLMTEFLGVKTTGEVRMLKGRGQTFGVEFRPGGLFPFLGLDMKSFAGKNLSSKESFPHWPPLPNLPWTEESLSEWLGSLENVLETTCLPEHQGNLPQISKIFTLLLNSEGISSIDELAELVSIPKRSLQRIFPLEVGLSIKDAIRITRFHRAIKNLNNSDVKNLADLALQSGFFDQPHMANEFKKLVDACPGKFKKYW